MTTISDLDARDLADKIRTKALGPVEVLDAHLDAIARLNPTLNAVSTVAEDSARRDAEAAERAVLTGGTLGPLHGVPVGIKDIIDTADMPTGWGFASKLVNQGRIHDYGTK